ncbi:MAG: 50S ribosomal protein L10 [Deltaproteobacteria bacterium]|nr:50S ribosomal protein L10 [Deltaproteobacteria bacterium]
MRVEKNQEIEKLKDSFSRAKSAIVTDYRGLTVSEMNEVRSKLRQASVELRVTKNTLARIAIKGTDSEVLSDSLKGPTAIAFSFDDPVAGAKVLKGLAEEHDDLELKAGLLGDKLLGIADIEALSKLPSKEILLGQLLSVLNGPMRGFVTVLSGNQRSLVQVLSAIGKGKEK